MTTATVVEPRSRSTRAPITTQRQTLGRAIHSEWIKIRTLRSTWIGLGTVLLILIGIGVIGALLSTGALPDDDATASETTARWQPFSLAPTSRCSWSAFWAPWPEPGSTARE